ncbi:MAG: DUF4327 family protein [Cyanobacteria bacterium P01_H01_bin.121]
MFSVIVFSIDAIQDEARQLVACGRVGRQQPIYTLSQHIPMREWEAVERELEAHGYLLRDRIIDLLGREDWGND